MTHTHRRQDIWALLFERKTREFPDDKGTEEPNQPDNWRLTLIWVIYTDGDTGRSYTFAQVKDTAIDFGKGLKAQWDWQKGDVITLFTPNCIDSPSVIWGAHWAGGIVSPANPGYTSEELAFQLKDAGAKAIATQRPFLDAAVGAAKIVGIPNDRIILLGDEKDARFKHFTSVRNTSGATRYRRTKIDPKKDLAFIPYSR